MLLDPELSNLTIVTVGIGRALLTSSSLDLVYHAYRQTEPAASLRHARLEAGLTGQDRRIGQGLDLVLAVEESDRVEFELTASAFRAGEAWGVRHGEWTRWHADGRPAIRARYVEGALDGELVAWFPNGERALCATFGNPFLKRVIIHPNTAPRGGGARA